MLVFSWLVKSVFAREGTDRTSEGSNPHKVKLRLDCAVSIYEREQDNATCLAQAGVRTRRRKPGLGSNTDRGYLRR